MVGEDASDDFVIHTASANAERHTRAEVFVQQFSSGFNTILTNETVGFEIQDVGERQPNGASCFFASATAAARGMGATEMPFQQVVAQMFAKAQEMGIVDAYGVVPIIAQKQITELLSDVNMEHETISYLPNNMTVDEIKRLGSKVADGLKSGYGVAMLIPSVKHYVLLHGYDQGQIRQYDPLSGADTSRPIQQVALNIGNVVNGEMQGQMNTGNSISFFKPQSDFVIEQVR